jgi:multimeric flavodoxin WrbA
MSDHPVHYSSTYTPKQAAEPLKLLALNGSPRGEESYTYRTACMLAEALNTRRPVEVEHVMLRDLSLPFCDGCLSCVKVGEHSCPDSETVQSVVARMHAADGLILSAPVHAFNVAALMKNWVEYSMYMHNRPRFFGKHAIVTATAAGGGHKVVLDYLETSASAWGYNVATRLGVSSGSWSKPGYVAQVTESCGDVADEFLAAYDKGCVPAPKAKQLVNFRIMQTMVQRAGEGTAANHAYWQERDWLSAKYYLHDAKLNPFGNALAAFVVGRVRSAIKSAAGPKPVR